MSNIVVVNGSPRPNFTTGKLLKEAARGAEEAGASVEYVNLYKTKPLGCVSCFACKRIGHESGTCCVKDDLHPLLERIGASDGLILGSPIYFGDVTSGMQALLERLVFPALSYDDFSSKVFEGVVNSAFFFTMNASDTGIYQELMQQKCGMLGMLHGSVECIPVGFTVQFTDYAKFHAAGLNGEARIAYEKEHFPAELARAYEVGRKLAMGE